jgi:hypothetical protein
MPDEKKDPGEDVQDMARELFRTPQELLAGSTVYTYDVEVTFGSVGVEANRGASTALWLQVLESPIEPGAVQEFASIKKRVDLSTDF